MAKTRSTLDQHIAVFGADGSGKTVLVSSFYGAMQDAKFKNSSTFRVGANSSGQGHKLTQAYLQMEAKNVTPVQDRFQANSYEFRIDFPPTNDAPASAGAANLVWHDYPGEWFHKDLSATEKTNAVKQFRNLLESNVALLLIDGAQMKAHAGEEERYLLSWFHDLTNTLELLRDEILEDGRKLDRFPRIWIVTLSKADLLPEMDVDAFRRIMNLHAGNQLSYLQEVLSTFVTTPEALSVGSHFLRLSSAKFNDDSIDLQKRIGIDLILPTALVVPMTQQAAWHAKFGFGAGLLQKLMGGGAGKMMVGLAAIKPLGKLVGKVGAKAGAWGGVVTLLLLLWEYGGEPARAKVEQLYKSAVVKKDRLTALVAQFQLDLLNGEQRGVYSHDEP